ncbi:MAG: UV DNA damage repair endonuclease UvsE [Desulfobacteraceae bacterium]|jgi:UV DNA damage endonuclease
MIRLGLCCVFVKAPIKFRRTTASYAARLAPKEQRRRLADLCMHNAHALSRALSYCRDHNIGAFRINSQILPLITHPQQGYAIQDLPGYKRIVDAYRQCGEFARRHDIRTSLHPDQFVVIASPRPDVRQKSLEELIYQAMVAEWVGADVINIHAGGAYGDKSKSLRRLSSAIKGLPAAITSRLTIENDDRTFSPADLLPVCNDTGIPMTYDVHHHRCLPDALSIGEATRAALKTWSREPLFHLSSPLDRFAKDTDRRHADYIDLNDFPKAWQSLDITVDVEAKAKEMAVEKLGKELANVIDY